MANGSTAALNAGQFLPKTSSRCVTESVTATHDFELVDCPLLDGMGVAKFVSSSTFSVGGYNWCIKFYPDAMNEETKEYALAFLNCLNPAKDVRTLSSLNMLAEEGEVKVTSNVLTQDTFSRTSTSWVYHEFVEKSKVKSLSDLHKGSFIIRCVLTVINESRTLVKKSFTTVPQPKLQEQLEHLLKDGEGADVTFSVSGQVFNAHRCVLAARSPVFKAELFGPMKENAPTKCITIDEIEPPIFSALLHFIYTDSIPMDDDDRGDGKTTKLQHLLVASDRYGLDSLRVMCEAELSESIGVETAATTLVLAEQHHCRDLREACIEFMVSQNMLRAVMATDGFKHLVASCPSVMTEILDKVSTHGY